METELERLVVRLTGDGSEFQRMLQQAQSSSQDAARQVEAATGRVEQMGQRLESFATNFARVLGALGLGAGLQQSLAAFQERENAAARLTATMEANGRQVGALMRQYTTFASEMQNLTVIGDDTTIGFLRQAESFGLTGQSAMNAVRGAISLAGAVDGTADSAANYIRMTAALEQGNVELAMRFARLVPQLRGITNESEFVARANHLIAVGFRTVQAEAQTSSGRIRQLREAFGDLLEEFGAVIAQAINPIVSGLRKVVTWLQELDQGTKIVIVTMMSLTAAMLMLRPALLLIGSLAGSVFSPMMLILVGASVAISDLIEKLGGVEGAWEAIQDTVNELWRAIQPIRDSLVDLFHAVSDTAAVVFESIKDQIMETFEVLSGGSEIVWSEVIEWISDAIRSVSNFIRENAALIRGLLIAYGTVILLKTAWRILAFTVGGLWSLIRNHPFRLLTGIIIGVLSLFVNWQDAILAVEFGIRNFADVANFAWLSIQLGFSEAVDFIKDAGISLVAFFAGIGASIVRIFTATWDAITGDIDFGDIMTEVGDAFDRTFADVAARMGAGVSDRTRRLRREVEDAGAALRESFEEFRRRRLEEMRVPDPDIPPIPGATPDEDRRRDDRRDDLIDDMAAIREEAGRLDAAGRMSAEAITRFEEYMDRLRTPRPTLPTARPAPVPAPRPAVAPPVPEMPGPAVAATAPLLATAGEAVRAGAVAADLIGSVPFIGEAMLDFMRGEAPMGVATPPSEVVAAVVAAVRPEMAAVGDAVRDFVGDIAGLPDRPGRIRPGDLVIPTPAPDAALAARVDMAVRGLVDLPADLRAEVDRVFGGGPRDAEAETRLLEDIRRFLAPGARPGSIYVHDTHVESVLSRMSAEMPEMPSLEEMPPIAVEVGSIEPLAVEIPTFDVLRVDAPEFISVEEIGTVRVEDIEPVSVGPVSVPDLPTMEPMAVAPFDNLPAIDSPEMPEMPSIGALDAPTLPTFEPMDAVTFGPLPTMPDIEAPAFDMAVESPDIPPLAIEASPIPVDLPGPLAIEAAESIPVDLPSFDAIPVDVAELPEFPEPPKVDFEAPDFESKILDVRLPKIGAPEIEPAVAVIESLMKLPEVGRLEAAVEADVEVDEKKPLTTIRAALDELSAEIEVEPAHEGKREDDGEVVRLLKEIKSAIVQLANKEGTVVTFEEANFQ